MTITVLYYYPGQKASIFLETTDLNGVRADGNINPFVSRVIFPDLSLACGFPQNLVKLDVGLYFFQFTLPINGSSIGSYVVDITYHHPTTNAVIQTLYQLVISSPFGTYSVGTN